MGLKGQIKKKSQTRFYKVIHWNSSKWRNAYSKRAILQDNSLKHRQKKQAYLWYIEMVHEIYCKRNLLVLIVESCRGTMSRESDLLHPRETAKGGRIHEWAQVPLQIHADMFNPRAYDQSMWAHSLHKPNLRTDSMKRLHERGLHDLNPRKD